jgi:putative ABC transport system permease protein
MPRTTSSGFLGSRRVPVSRRQLFAEPLKLAVAILAVAAAVALVLLLTGLRRGMGEQVTTYLDHQPPVLVGQAGARDFLSQTSVITEATVARVRGSAGVAEASPISEGYAMLNLHGKPVLAVLIGSDLGRGGGPWALAAGRKPQALGEVALDRVLASEHGLRVGSTLRFRGRDLPVVGLTRGTGGFMTPLAFATRETANALNAQPQTASFVLVTPKRGVAPAALAAALERDVPGISARLTAARAGNDRALFVGAWSGPLFAMIAIAAAVAVMVIAVTVFAETRDKAREYATLKAIGMTRSGLLRVVAYQATALSVLGVASGFLLALLASRGISALAPKYLIALTSGDALLMAAFAFVFALLAGFVPARFLANLDPMSAFRS